jgi:hypothetical protein
MDQRSVVQTRSQGERFIFSEVQFPKTAVITLPIVHARARSRFLKKPPRPKRARRLCGVTSDLRQHQNERLGCSDEACFVSFTTEASEERNSMTPGAMHMT